MAQGVRIDATQDDFGYRYSFDTDEKNSCCAVLNRARNYSVYHPKLTFSLITRYEILRGLKAKNAVTQIASFNVFCANNEVLPITERIVVLASDIYADLHRKGQLIGDVDILIASTAIEYGLVLATNNVAHFGRIPRLQIDNWQT